MLRKPTFLPGELLAGVSGLSLGIAMFALEWFGIDGIPGRTRSLAWAENAWHGLTVTRWLMVATIAAALGSVAIHAGQRSHGARTSTGLVVTVLGALTLALLIYRVLIELPSPATVVDQKLGALVGLFSAGGVAVGGYAALLAERNVALSSRTRKAQGAPGDPAPGAVGGGGPGAVGAAAAPAALGGGGPAR